MFSKILGKIKGGLTKVLTKIKSKVLRPKAKKVKTEKPQEPEKPTESATIGQDEKLRALQKAIEDLPQEYAFYDKKRKKVFTYDATALQQGFLEKAASIHLTDEKMNRITTAVNEFKYKRPSSVAEVEDWYEKLEAML